MTVTEAELINRTTGIRVTMAQVLANIVSEDYFTAADGVMATGNVPKGAHELMTFCVLTLKNGFTVTGQSACADPTNYKKDIGERIAKQDAINKIWPLMGYELRTKLALIENSIPPTMGLFHTYVGTKVVHASPMSRQMWCDVRGWALPGNENGSDEGYIIEYADAQRPNMPDFKGYVSWSPKDVFDGSYQKMAPEPVETPPEETPHVVRLRTEYQELCDRLGKLDTFLDTPVFSQLDTVEQDELVQQHLVMQEYQAVLARRLRRATA